MIIIVIIIMIIFIIYHRYRWINISKRDSVVTFHIVTQRR